MRYQGVTNTRMNSITCRMRLPYGIDTSDLRHVIVLCTFRKIELADVGYWLMPRGQPRTDRELIEEVLLSAQEISEETYAPVSELDIASLLHSERVAALIVSTYLSVLQSKEEVQFQTIQSLQRNMHRADRHERVLVHRLL